MATAQEFIDEVITNALTTATENTEAATEAADELIALKAGFYIVPPDSEDGFAVEAVEPTIPNAADNIYSYESQWAAIIADLVGRLDDFFTTYFPLTTDAYDEANAWLVDVITNGGTGVNTSVEDQIWQRDRDRRTAEGMRTKAQISTGYAAKGHFLPAGSMLKKLEEVDFADLAANGVASTSVAAKQLEIEIETVKFAITEAMKSRILAMNAAADYIRAIASAPGSAVDVAGLNSDAQAKMINASANWYEARLSRDKIVLSSALAEMASRDDIYKHRRTNATQNDQVDAQSLAAAADVLARTASAALSSLNSIVSSGISAFA